MSIANIRKQLLVKGSITLVVFLFSCRQNQVFDQVVTLPSEGWSAENVLLFNVSIEDTAQVYDVFLHVRNAKNYGYSNLWLFIETTAPNGNSLRDTVEIRLADIDGRWLGTGIGNVNTLLVPYITQVSFKFRGIYTFAITQGMRDEVLEGVLNMGLRIDYHN
jgi:gliding motility-associated lipoprotein GldH